MIDLAGRAGKSFGFDLGMIHATTVAGARAAAPRSDGVGDSSV